jgi:adenylylsulfate kinase-like enzyme
MMTGTTGAGKSVTVAVVMLPGPTAGIETVWFLDGGAVRPRRSLSPPATGTH